MPLKPLTPTQNHRYICEHSPGALFVCHEFIHNVTRTITLYDEWIHRFNVLCCELLYQCTMVEGLVDIDSKLGGWD